MTVLALLRRIHLALRGSLVLAPWLLYLALADLCLSALLPVSVLFPDLTYRLASRIARSVWKAVQLIFTRRNGAKITVSGAELPQGESAIVVCNHVSWTDFYLIQELAIRSRMLGYCRWFAKQQLKWVPFLGWGLWAMGMPLISRNWMRDQRELDRVFRGVVGRQWPTCKSDTFALPVERHGRRCIDVFQGSFRTVRPRGLIQTNTGRLSSGARRTTSLFHSILCIHAPEASLLLSSS